MLEGADRGASPTAHLRHRRGSGTTASSTRTGHQRPCVGLCAVGGPTPAPVSERHRRTGACGGTDELAPPHTSHTGCGRLLIANRGEIAVRIAAHRVDRLGIDTVGGPFGRSTSTRCIFRSFGSPNVGRPNRPRTGSPAESYLRRRRRCWHAAKRTRTADAVHPGYGFPRRERIVRPRRCEDAGLDLGGSYAPNSHPTLLG